MKRLWVGVIFLAAVLLVGIVLSLVFPRFHQPMALQLEQAAEKALAEDWAGAEKMVEDAHRRWESLRDFSAALTDHQPLEEMERLFLQLKLWQEQQLATEFAADCLRLAQLTRDLGQSQGLTWWSFL